MKNIIIRILWVTALIAGALVLPVATATAAPSDFAPLDRPGPALTIPTDKLAASLRCTADVTGARRAPVLLLAGTAIDSKNNFGWNWEPALTKAGIPWCTSDIPDGGIGFHNNGDEQVRGEYVTYAIRTMHAMAGRTISILGHSQGGSIMRWSLRFWPDTRAMVDDVIGIAPDNHGAVTANALCALPCLPAHWQIRPGSAFKAALNSGQETFAGISYTTIRSEQDELVLPHDSSKLSGPGSIANLRIQDKCPLYVSDHVTIGTTDAVAEAYAMDALNNPGPAALSRINPLVCLKPLMSGVNPITAATDLAAAVATLGSNALLDPKVPAEPPLGCYTRATGCPAPAKEA